MEVVAGFFDSPPSLAGAFQVGPAVPADFAWSFDKDADVEERQQGFVQGVYAFDHDDFVGCDWLFAFALVGVEGPEGDMGGTLRTEVCEVLSEPGEIGVVWVVAEVFGGFLVVGEVVVGGDDAGGDCRGEGAFAGSDGACDTDDNGGAGGSKCRGAGKDGPGCGGPGNGARATWHGKERTTPGGRIR